MTRATKKSGTSQAARPPMEDEVAFALDWLERRGTKAGRDSMVRFGVVSDRAFGVAMRDIQILARRLGRSHELAEALWRTGWYEARMVAAYVDEPERLTPAQMDRWCRDFDNWGICDTVCFVLFDKTPQAWPLLERWAGRRDEFVRRAAFALLWGLTVHDKSAADSAFVEALGLVERAATDDRHFVKKGVNMALRAIGKRTPALHAAAVTVATRLAASPHASARWIGSDALRELASPSVSRRLAAKRSAPASATRRA